MKGGSYYGASTITNTDGSRMPSEVELDGAKFQGKHVAETAQKLSVSLPKAGEKSDGCC